MRQSEALSIIANRVATCEKCGELCEYRKENSYKTVPGVGNPNARIMVIGEAPGKNEAEQGEPFVGKAGTLLTNILQACGWPRETVFISNILKCRPPGNRDPLPEEAKNCRLYLDMQIKTVNPEWILCFGRIASINLLGAENDRTMGSFRGSVHDYQGRKVICTYHPSYLLRNPKAKEQVWNDLEIVREKAESE